MLQKFRPEFRPAQDLNEFGHQGATREQRNPSVVREIQNLLPGFPPQSRPETTVFVSRNQSHAAVFQRGRRSLLPGSPPSSMGGMLSAAIPRASRRSSPRLNRRSCSRKIASTASGARRPAFSISLSRSSGSSRVTAMMFPAPPAEANRHPTTGPTYLGPARERRCSHRHRPPKADENAQTLLLPDDAAGLDRRPRPSALSSSGSSNLSARSESGPTPPRQLRRKSTGSAAGFE